MKLLSRNYDVLPCFLGELNMQRDSLFTILLRRVLQIIRHEPRILVTTSLCLVHALEDVMRLLKFVKLTLGIEAACCSPQKGSIISCYHGFGLSVIISQGARTGSRRADTFAPRSSLRSYSSKPQSARPALPALSSSSPRPSHVASNKTPCRARPFEPSTSSFPASTMPN